MRFSTLICLTGILGAQFALAVPSPAPLSLIPGANTTNFEECQQAGVDPYGPIPSDYDKQEDGKYFFSPGSKASLWVRAQIDLQGSPHAKRQVSQEQRGLTFISSDCHFFPFLPFLPSFFFKTGLMMRQLGFRTGKYWHRMLGQGLVHWSRRLGRRSELQC